MKTQIRTTLLYSTLQQAIEIEQRDTCLLTTEEQGQS